jgi:hypothetical protein
METYSLSESQRERAKTLYEQVDAGEITSPTEFVDEWQPRHKVTDYDPELVPYPEATEFIDPSKIAGTTKTNLSRFSSGRIKTHLARFYHGEFERQRRCPPRLQKIEGQFYVTSDGIHRSLTAKALGISELYVKYSIPPKEVLVSPEEI